MRRGRGNINGKSYQPEWATAQTQTEPAISSAAIRMLFNVSAASLASRAVISQVK